MKTKEILYIYVRVSTSEQAEKDLSIPQQTDLGIKLAKQLGMAYKVFTEAGESASHENFDNRPQLLELLKLVKAGEVKHVFVFDQTRLSRNDTTKAIISQELKKQNVILHTPSKTFDFKKSEDTLSFKILEAVESYESSLRKARFQLGYVSANRKGRYLKGIPPFGYRKNKKGYLIVDEEEKSIFLKIVDLYLSEGYGTNQIANYLNDNLVPTKTSKIFKNGYKLREGIANRRKTKHITKNEWNPGSINTMLKSEVYCGRRKFKIAENKYEYVKCEPIISEETFERLQRKREFNAINKKREDKHFYLLKNLVECGNCGQPFHGRVKPNRGEYTYRCNSKRNAKSRCKCRGINITKLNNIVWHSFRCSAFYYKLINHQLLLHLEDSHEFDKRLEILQSELASIKKEEVRNEKRLKNLIRQELDSRIPEKVYSELLSEIKLRSENLETEKMTCLANIKKMGSLKNEIKADVIEDHSAYINAKDEIDRIYPGATKEDKIKARNQLRRAISNITVTYLPKELKHVVEVSFHKFGVKRKLEHFEFFEFGGANTQRIEVRLTDKIPFKQVKLPRVPNEYFVSGILQGGKKKREQYETKILKSAENQKGKKQPPFNIQRHLKLCDEDSGTDVV